MPDLEALQPLALPVADELVYQALRDEIVRGLPPGTALQLRDLAARFTVSTMPIRTALDRLQQDGLIVQQRRRGATVAPLDPADLVDIQTVRAGLEGHAARLGVERISDDSIAWMHEEFDQLRHDWDAGRRSLDRYLTTTVAIHQACYESTELPKLLHLIGTHRRMAERYLRVALVDADDLGNDLGRQAAFVEACEQRDPDGAERAVHALLMWTVTKVSPLISTDA